MEILRRLDNAIRSARDFQQAAQATCEILRREISHYNWVGVYMVAGGDLVLEAWDGPAATEHTRIPIGEGICGLAARESRSIIVDDVARDPRYLQCFLNTKSEIVVPMFKGGEVIGEIDIDSDRVAAFNDIDRHFLEEVAGLLSRVSPGSA